MDWTSIIVAILSGTTLGGVYEAVKYRRQNAKLKQNEVTQNDVETQTAQLDYADRYFNGMLDLLEKVKQSQDKGEQNQDRMIEQLEQLAKQTDKQEGLLADIVTYLNGDFQDFLKRTHGKGGRP